MSNIIRKKITKVLICLTLVFSLSQPSAVHAEQGIESVITCARAMASVKSGKIDYSSKISLHTVTKGAKIYFTTDGTMPSREKKEYKEPLSCKDIFGESVYSEYDEGDCIGAELKTVSVLNVNGEDIYSDVSVYKYTLKENNISAYDINIPGLFKEKLENDSDYDYYSFRIKEKTTVEITLDFSQDSICGAALYDKEKNIIDSSEYAYAQFMKNELEAGEYYIKVYGIEGCEGGAEYTLRAGDAKDVPNVADNIEENSWPSIQELIYVPDNNERVYEEALKNYIYAYGAVVVPCKDKTYILTGWDDEEYFCENGESLDCQTIINEHIENASFVVKSDYNMNYYEKMYGDLTAARNRQMTVSGLTGISSVYCTGLFWEVIDSVSFDCSKSGINYSIDVVTDKHTYRIAEGVTRHSGINNVMCNTSAYIEPGKEFEVIVWLCSFDKYVIPLKQASVNQQERASYIKKAPANENLLESGMCAPLLVYSRAEGMQKEEDYSRMFTGENECIQTSQTHIKPFFTTLPEEYKGNEIYGFTEFANKIDELYENKHKKEAQTEALVYKAVWLNIKKNNFKLFNRADSISTDTQKLDVNVTSTSGTDVYLTACLGDNVDDDYIVWKISGDASTYVLKNEVSKSGERINVCRVKKKGRLTITAYARSNPGLMVVVNVSVNKINTNNLKDSSIKVVKSLKLNKKSIVLRIGKSKKLKAYITPSNAMNASVSWQSSNRKVCVVNSKGVVTAKRGGKCYITALNEFSEKSASCKVVVGYKISYHCRGGKNNSANPHSYMKGERIVLKNPRRAGYIFKGWYTKRSMKPDSRIRIIRRTSHRDYRLFAKWQKKR